MFTVVSAMLSSASSVRNAWCEVTITFGIEISRDSRSSLRMCPERSSKKTSASSSDADLKLTAAEKKLVRLYRKADAQTRKTAVALLEGTAGAGDLIGALLAGKTGSASSSQSSAQTGEIGDLIGSLLGGKAENTAAASGGDGNLLSSLLEGMLGKTGK